MIVDLGSGTGRITVPGYGVQSLELDLPLAALKAAGHVELFSFTMAQLPAKARVFPSTAELEIVDPLHGSGGALTFAAIVTGGNAPAGTIYSAATIGGVVGIYGGGAAGSGDLSGLCSSQGSQTILAQIDLTSASVHFDNLTVGHLKVRILFIDMTS